jgi:acetoin utilization protein AcuB
VVRENHTLEGIITVTDLLCAYTAQADAEPGVGVGSMMQTQVLTATPTMSLAEVQRLMHANNIRHVPVVSGKHLVGMMTDRDLREATPSPATTLARGEIAYHMETTPIKTCMTRDMVWIGPDVTMRQAALLLVQRDIGCLPVVDNGTLVGVVTDSDCVRALLSTARGA